MKDYEEKYHFVMRHYDGTIVRVSGCKEGICEMLEDYKSFLLACTFQSYNVNKIIYCEDYTDED